MKYKLTPVYEIPKDEFDIRLEEIRKEQHAREKKYGITINPNCHSVTQHNNIRRVSNLVKVKARQVCLSCGSPTNTYSRTPMFGVQAICSGCRDLRNKTHWDTIGEALRTKTWSAKVWRDRRQIRDYMDGGL